VLVVRPRQPVEAQRLADVGFDPVGELRVLALPLGKPRRQVANWQLCIILSVNSLAATGWMVCWATDLARSAKSVAQQAAQIKS
jgi:hypothetical protein